MSVVELRITQQYARIGVNTTPVSMNFQSSRAKIESTTVPAQLEIESPRPVLHIDQSQCFADAGLKSPSCFTAERAAEGHQGIMEAIERISAKGDQLAKIKGASVADIALQRTTETHVYDVKAIPQQPPEIRCEVYPVKFDYQPAQIERTVTPASIDTAITPGRVDIYLLQQNHLEINWRGNNYDQTA